jgi:hypothetical protein
MADQPTEAPAPAQTPAPEPGPEPQQEAEAPISSALHTVVAEASAAEQRIVHAIEAWIDACLRNGPIAQATEAWNHLLSSLPALKAMLLKGE